MVDVSDYLKANCRSWETDCNTLEDAQTLANHLSQTFPNESYEELLGIAKDWVGYEEPKIY